MLSLAGRRGPSLPQAPGQWGEPVLSHRRSPQCRIDILDVPSKMVYDVLHDIKCHQEWDTDVIDTHDIIQLAASADVGYYACEWGLEAQGEPRMSFGLC